MGAPQPSRPSLASDNAGFDKRGVDILVPLPELARDAIEAILNINLAGGDFHPYRMVRPINRLLVRLMDGFRFIFSLLSLARAPISVLRSGDSAGSVTRAEPSFNSPWNFILLRLPAVVLVAAAGRSRRPRRAEWPE